MTIDISHVSYWSTGMIVYTAILVIVVAVLIALMVVGSFKKGSDLAFHAGFALFAVTLFGGMIGFGAIGNLMYSDRVDESKTSALSETYQDVTLTSDGFTASNEGEYVRGFLVDQGDGVFEVLESKR